MTCMQVTKKNVLGNKELQQRFFNQLELAADEREISNKLLRELLGRVINTMAYSFFQCQNILERVAEKRGVDAQVALRDRLKVYASEKKSKLFE